MTTKQFVNMCRKNRSNNIFFDKSGNDVSFVSNGSWAIDLVEWGKMNLVPTPTRKDFDAVFHEYDIVEKTPDFKDIFDPIQDDYLKGKMDICTPTSFLVEAEDQSVICRIFSTGTNKMVAVNEEYFQFFKKALVGNFYAKVEKDIPIVSVILNGKVVGVLAVFRMFNLDLSVVKKLEGV